MDARSPPYLAGADDVGQRPKGGQPVWKQSEICGPGGFRLGRSCLRILRPGASGGLAMHRFIDGEDRMQQALLPHSLEDYVDEENPVRVIEVFIDELDLAALGFSGMTPAP